MMDTSIVVHLLLIFYLTNDDDCFDCSAEQSPIISYSITHGERVGVNEWVPIDSSLGKVSASCPIDPRPSSTSRNGQSPLQRLQFRKDLLPPAVILHHRDLSGQRVHWMWRSYRSCGSQQLHTRILISAVDLNSTLGMRITFQLHNSNNTFISYTRGGITTNLL